MAIGNLPAWNDEYVPASVRAIGQAVVDHFPELTWSHIGFKGDDNHGGGYHRSLRWNYTTLGYGVNYSDRISRDTSQRNTHRRNAIRAIDITAPPHILIPMCRRVDTAMRAGLLDDVREWYGNDDGDNRVDGYDNFRNIVVASDASHLWHFHGSLYTDTVDQAHDMFTNVLIGQEEETFMALTPAEETEILSNSRWLRHLLERGERLGGDQTSNGGIPINWLVRQITELDAADVAQRNMLTMALDLIQQLITTVNTGGGDLDSAAIIAAIRGEGEAQKQMIRERWEREEEAKRLALAELERDESAPPS